MTRFLSSALGAQEPGFSHSIRRLEQAAGLPSADIRLTSEVSQKLRVKIAELGLDPADTTGPELYAALQLKLANDEAAVRRVLDLEQDSPAATVLARTAQYLERHEMPKNCFALKTSVARRLLKKKPPRSAMKKLGYRSVDSMLKHESPVLLMAAAVMAESASWVRSFREQYAKLTPSDFEARKITVVFPKSKRWQPLTYEYAERARSTLLSFPELGAVVLLPVRANIDGLAITALLLAAEEMNAIRAYSSFIKLQQVKPHFGRMVRQAVEQEPLTSAELAGQPVPWKMIQRYYATFKDAYHADIFEPHVQQEDLEWRHGEEILAGLESSLQFWRGTNVLALMHEGEPVSLNALDVALAHVNQLSFGERVVHFFRNNLWHELMMRYLHQENLEAAVHQQLSRELTDENLSQEITV